MEKLTMNTQYDNNTSKFVSDDVAANIMYEVYSNAIDVTVENLLESRMEFTRHDVIKTLRQIAGPSIECSYDEWKDMIVESINSFMELYDYESRFDGYKFVYFPNKNDVATSDSAKTMKYDIDAAIDMLSDGSPDSTLDSTSTKCDNSAVNRERYTISTKHVRAAGGYPGAVMDIVVCDKSIFINIDPDKNELERANSGNKPVLLHTNLKVDKYCNLRISKYMMDIANMTDNGNVKNDPQGEVRQA